MSVLNTDVSCRTTFWKLEINYKITKMVRALWLADRRVCMRVCKHGCEYVNMVVTSRCFAFRALITQARIWKILSWKPRQVYFIHPFPRRLKLGKSLETCCVNFFFAWADIIKRKQGLFTLTSFVSFVYMQDFKTGKNFSFNQCAKQ